MKTIQLAVFRKAHPPALAIGQQVIAMRLVAHVSLATSQGWGSFDPAVIDTGAPVSLFPPAIWHNADYRALGRVRVGGLSRRAECQIPAILATVRCTLSDGAASIGPFETQAYLSELDDVPTLIGMLGFIDRGILHVDVNGGNCELRVT